MSEILPDSVTRAIPEPFAIAQSDIDTLDASIGDILCDPSDNPKYREKRVMHKIGEATAAIIADGEYSDYRQNNFMQYRSYISDCSDEAMVTMQLAGAVGYQSWACIGTWHTTAVVVGEHSLWQVEPYLLFEEVGVNELDTDEDEYPNRTPEYPELVDNFGDELGYYVLSDNFGRLPENCQKLTSWMLRKEFDGTAMEDMRLFLREEIAFAMFSAIKLLRTLQIRASVSGHYDEILQAKRKALRNLIPKFPPSREDGSVLAR